MTSVEKYDVAIVLGNLMDAQGNLNEESQGRVNTAAEAFHLGQVPIILACGWPYRADSDLPIADAMARYAIRNLNVPASKVLVERQSRDTVGDAVFSKLNFSIPNDWRTILVVTSAYHCARSLEIFSFVYGPSYKIAVRGSEQPETPALMYSETQSTIAFRDTFSGIEAGDHAEAVKRLRDAHPYYNGKVYEKIPF